MSKLRRGRGQPTREDPGGWEETPRTDEVKRYSQSLWQLVLRSLSTRTLSLAIGLYIAFVMIYVFGAPGIERGTNDEGRKVFIFTTVGWGLLFLFFAVTIMTKIYRPRWERVSHKTNQEAHGSDRQPVRRQPSQQRPSSRQPSGQEQITQQLGRTG